MNNIILAYIPMRFLN